MLHGFIRIICALAYSGRDFARFSAAPAQIKSEIAGPRGQRHGGGVAGEVEGALAVPEAFAQQAPRLARRQERDRSGGGGGQNS